MKQSWGHLLLASYSFYKQKWKIEDNLKFQESKGTLKSVKIMVNIIGYSCHEFLKSYLMVEVKVTAFDFVSSAYKGHS